MSIKSITIGNFKGIRDKVKIDLKPVTLLFGQNSGGKSTIIQAFHYAWEVMVRHNLDPNFTELGGKEIDLGGFENIVYGHELSRSISIRLDLDLTDKGLPIYYIDYDYMFLAETAGKFDHENILYWNIDPKNISTAWVQIEISWNRTIGRFVVSTYEVGLNEELIARVQVPPGGDRAKIVYINFLHPLLTSEKEGFKKALGKVLDKEGSNGSGYERIKDFKKLIDVFSGKPELWLDQKVFPPDEYKRLSEITKRAKEYDEEYKKFEKLSERLNVISILNVSPGKESAVKVLKSKYGISDYDLKEKHVKEAHDEFDKMVKALKSKYGVSNYDFYATFAPYDFLFFCLDQLGLKSTIGDLDIGIGKGDALPNFDDNYGLKIEIDTSGSDKIVDYNDDYDEEPVRSAISQFVVGPGKILRDELKKLHYLGPIRSRIPRDYVPNRSTKKLNWANGIAAWDVLHKEDEEFIGQVNYWLEDPDRLKSGYRMIRKSYKEIEIFKNESGNTNSEKIVQQFNSAPTKTRLFLKDKKNRVEVQPLDVGTGISQVLPVIVSALHFKKGIVAIEQPELHIHPAFQTALGDLFISQSTEKNISFLIETHSEHLLLRLLRRIRETHEGELPLGITGFDPARLAIYYIERGEQGVLISELRVSKDGDSEERWPDGFFEERHGELY